MSNGNVSTLPDYSGTTLEELLSIMLNNSSSVVRSLAKNEIIQREKNFRKAIEDALAEIEGDERLGYPTATVDVNAPLALIQCALSHQVKTLKEVLKVLDLKDGKQ